MSGQTTTTDVTSSGSRKKKASDRGGGGGGSGRRSRRRPKSTISSGFALEDENDHNNTNDSLTERNPYMITSNIWTTRQFATESEANHSMESKISAGQKTAKTKSPQASLSSTSSSSSMKHDSKPRFIPLTTVEIVPSIPVPKCMTVAADPASKSTNEENETIIGSLIMLDRITSAMLQQRLIIREKRLGVFASEATLAQIGLCSRRKLENLHADKQNADEAEKVIINCNQNCDDKVDNNAEENGDNREPADRTIASMFIESFGTAVVGRCSMLICAVLFEEDLLVSLRQQRYPFPVISSFEPIYVGSSAIGTQTTTAQAATDSPTPSPSIE